jgi:hypothetical protein
MKKILFFVCFLLVAVNAYADQTLNGRQPREWEHSTDSKPLEGKDYTDNTSTFANSINTGNNAVGNAGYQALLAVDSGGTVRTYYLWVDASSTSVGVLKMASFAAIKAWSSFPYGDWRSSTGFNAGIKVSSQ